MLQVARGRGANEYIDSVQVGLGFQVGSVAIDQHPLSKALSNLHERANLVVEVIVSNAVKDRGASQKRDGYKWYYANS